MIPSFANNLTMENKLDGNPGRIFTIITLDKPMIVSSLNISFEIIGISKNSGSISMNKQTIFRILVWPLDSYMWRRKMKMTIYYKEKMIYVNGKLIRSVKQEEKLLLFQLLICQKWISKTTKLKDSLLDFLASLTCKIKFKTIHLEYRLNELDLFILNVFLSSITIS